MHPTVLFALHILLPNYGTMYLKTCYFDCFLCLGGFWESIVDCDLLFDPWIQKVCSSGWDFWYKSTPCAIVMILLNMVMIFLRIHREMRQLSIWQVKQQRNDFAENVYCKRRCKCYLSGDLKSASIVSECFLRHRLCRR